MGHHNLNLSVFIESKILHCGMLTSFIRDNTHIMSTLRGRGGGSPKAGVGIVKLSDYDSDIGGIPK